MSAHVTRRIAPDGQNGTLGAALRGLPADERIPARILLSPGETEGDGSASGGLATLQNPEEQEIKSIVRHSRPAIMRLNDLISFPPICRSFPVP